MYGFGSLSTMFDSMVSNLLGSSLDDFFIDPPKNQFTYSRQSVNKGGHSFTSESWRDKQGKVCTKYYSDNKEVKDRERIESVKEQLKGVESQTFYPQRYEPITCNNKLPKEIVDGTNTPHMDMIHREDGTLELRFALAGVPVSQIEISSEDDFLYVEVKPSKGEKTNRPKSVYLQKGIRNLDEDFGSWKKIFIDPTKYDITTADWNYDDGLLTITVGKAEKANQKRLVIKTSTSSN